MITSPDDRKTITALLSHQSDSPNTTRLKSLVLNLIILMNKGFTIDIQAIHRPHIQVATALLLRARTFIGTDADTAYFKALRLALSRYLLVGKLRLLEHGACTCPDWLNSDDPNLGLPFVSVHGLDCVPVDSTVKPGALPQSKKIYYCSGCGELGRNWRTCSSNPEAVASGRWLHY